MTRNAAHQLSLLLHQLKVGRPDNAALRDCVEHFLQIMVNPIRLERVHIVVLDQAAPVICCVERLDQIRAFQIKFLKIKFLYHYASPLI